MVCLNDCRDGAETFLSIKDDDNEQAVETRLHVSQSLLCAARTSIGTTSSFTAPNLPDECMSIKVKPKPSTKLEVGYTLVSTLCNKNVSDKNFPLLGRRIISKETAWKGRSLQIPGESHFIQGYWEWTEDILSRFEQVLRDCSIYDAVYASLYSYARENSVLRAFFESWCPRTNTLQTTEGEYSISMWDTHQLGGLPILGLFYDETVPSYEAMQKTDANGFKDIPKACQYLLAAYHHLMKQSSEKGVTAQKWVEFWCKRMVHYKEPPRRRRESTCPPKVTKDPSGNITRKMLNWTSEECAIFRLLDIIDEERKQSTYVAAFISCWLCTFVLPESDKRFIRPSTFHVSSMMTRGKTFSLAVSVLASIYRGLNIISNSSRPNHSGSVFPAHYLYSWIAHYFRTNHEMSPCPNGPKMVLYSGSQHAKYFSDADARKLIHEGRAINLGFVLEPFRDCSSLFDDGKLNAIEMSFFISLRAAYLPLRYDGSFLLEPYAPNRFGRQFGFCQNIVGALDSSVDTLNISYEEFAWRWDIVLRQGSRIRVHMKIPLKYQLRDFVTSAYESWWKTTNVKELLANVGVLNAGIEPDSTKKSLKITGKRDASCLLQINARDNARDKQADEAAIVLVPPKNNISPPLRKDPPDTGASSERGSETNFKHNRGGKRIRTDPATGDWFDCVPDFSDPPLELALDGELNLNDEIPELFGDVVVDNFPLRRAPGKGKELQKLKQPMNASLSSQDEDINYSPTDSPRSVSGPHSLEVAAKLTLEKRGTSKEVVGVTSNIRKVVQAETSVMPETAVKGILHSSLQMATAGLLNTVKNAKFSDVEKITKEAILVYRCVKNMKGDPTRLQEKIDAYATTVASFRYLEEARSERLQNDALDQKLKLEHEKLAKANSALGLTDKECVIISQKISSLNEEISNLEEKLKIAHASRDELTSDLKKSELSRASICDQVKEINMRIEELAAIPRLSEEDVAVFEAQQRSLLELQSSLDPGAWMDLVL